MMAALSFGAAVTIASITAGCFGEVCIAPVVTPLTAAATCGSCHRSEEEAWRASPHARAYVSNGFKERTHDYAVSECLACHAPAGPAAALARPALRSATPAEGVTCVSCHALGAGAHPAASARKLFDGGADLRAARFCGSCHEDTFVEWSAAGSGKRLDCAACHMPRTPRGGELLSDHSLLHDRDTLSRNAVALDVVAAKRGTPPHVGARVALENIAADHALPTGKYGFRDLRLTVEVIDRAGRSLATRSIDLVVSGRGDARPLAAHERREIAFDLEDKDALAVAVRARLEKAGPWGPEPAPRASALREVE